VPVNTANWYPDWY